MCGIFGSPNITPTLHRMLPHLALAMASRGRDGWGASDGERVIKHKGDIICSWREEAGDIERWPQGIFHTRGASHGTPKEAENAHPFEFYKPDGSRVIGIHNGLVANHDELDTKYGRVCEVDSEHLWMNRAEGKDWTDIRGWGNLAWWENSPEGQRLSLCRFNTDSLKVAKLEQGEYVFCSEQGPVSAAGMLYGNPVKSWFNIEEYHLYWFAPNDAGEMTLFKGTKQEFGRTAPTSNYSPPWVGNRSTNCGTVWTSSTYCLKCNMVRLHNDDDVLCFSCLNGLVDAYNEHGGEAWTMPAPHRFHDWPAMDYPDEAHIVLKVSGSADACACFHWICGQLDSDYPQAPVALRRRPGKALICDRCHGGIYYCPVITPNQFKNLGRQVNCHAKVHGHVKVRVPMYNTTCAGHEAILLAMAGD